MKIVVIGATGMVGSRLVAEAVARGHQVTAASRNPDPHPHARGITAILAVRPAPGHQHTLATLTTNVLDVASSTDTRVLVVGGAGPLRSPTAPDLLVVDDPAYVPADWQTVAAASVAQLAACRQRPDASWTYLSPPAVLEPGTRTGRYRRGATTLLTNPDGSSRISVEDLAVAVVDEIEQPTFDRHFTVVELTVSHRHAAGAVEVVV